MLTKLQGLDGATGKVTLAHVVPLLVDSDAPDWKGSIAKTRAFSEARSVAETDPEKLLAVQAVPFVDV